MATPGIPTNWIDECSVLEAQVLKVIVYIKLLEIRVVLKTWDSKIVKYILKILFFTSYRPLSFIIEEEKKNKLEKVIIRRVYEGRRELIFSIMSYLRIYNALKNNINPPTLRLQEKFSLILHSHIKYGFVMGDQNLDQIFFIRVLVFG